MSKIYYETINGVVDPKRRKFKSFFIRSMSILFGIGLVSKISSKLILILLDNTIIPYYLAALVNSCNKVSKVSFGLGIALLSLTALVLIVQFLYFNGNKYNTGKPILRYNQLKIQNQIESGLIDEGIINPKIKTPNTFEVGEVIANLDYIEPFIMIEVIGDTAKKMNSIESLINSNLRNKFSDFIVDDIEQSIDGRWYTFYLRDSSISLRWRPTNLKDMIPKNPYILKLMENVHWDISKNCHGLVTGSTGSGKTFMFYGLLVQIFLSGSTIFICDPKVSGLVRLSDFLPPNHVLSKTEDITELISKAINIMKQRQQQINSLAKQNGKFDVDFTHFPEMKPIYIVIDEVASLFTSFQSEKDKKTFLHNLTQLIMMSRSAGICILLLTQQGNVQALGGNSSIREQLSLRILLGSSSQQSRTMTFGDGFEYPKTRFVQGEGLILLDGVNNTPSLIETTDLTNLGDDLYTIFKEAYKIGHNR
ncbi:hypothetical protein [Sporosarcina sp. FSL K6-3508]|uniref:hypothetical protein n=1 Tax=Sporosarcina sp. FSL K6-3508 TaxID=2921557 RepID=UPI00315AB7AD